MLLIISDNVDLNLLVVLSQSSVDCEFWIRHSSLGTHFHPEYGPFDRLYQRAVWYPPERKSIPYQADPFFSITDVSCNVANVFIIRGSV